MRFLVTHRILKFITLISVCIITSLFGCNCGGGGEKSSESCSSGSVTLTWDAPKTNVDGTPLTDLAGYKIYYGMEPHNYVVLIDVGSASCQNVADRTECSSTVKCLPKGTYYFAVTAYDKEGNMSMYSNEVSKTAL